MDWLSIPNLVDGQGVPQKHIVSKTPRLNIKFIIAKTLFPKGLGAATPISAGYLCCQLTILVYIFILKKSREGVFLLYS